MNNRGSEIYLIIGFCLFAFFGLGIGAYFLFGNSCDGDNCEDENVATLKTDSNSPVSQDGVATTLSSNDPGAATIPGGVTVPGEITIPGKVTDTSTGDTVEGATQPPASGGNKPIVIFDTDMGPDIDDTFALGMIHSYADRGVWDIGAVVLSRQSPKGNGVKYIDAFNTYYGRPNIPIGNYKDGHPEDDKGQYDYMVTQNNKFPFDIGAVPEGHQVIRKVLESAGDQQVIIVMTGFTGNLGKLLDSPGGVDLVEKKVRTLSLVGGDYSGFNGQIDVEYNLNHHSIHQPTVGHSKTLLAKWPSEIVQSEYSVGYEVLLPSSAVKALPDGHILKETYFFKDASAYFWHVADGQGSFNMRSWDMLGVIAVAEDLGTYFPASKKASNVGKISGQNSGAGGVKTVFSANASGNHVRAGLAKDDYGLRQGGGSSSSAEMTRTLNRMVEIVKTPVGN